MNTRFKIGDVIYKYQCGGFVSYTIKAASWDSQFGELYSVIDSDGDLHRCEKLMNLFSTDKLDALNKYIQDSKGLALKYMHSCVSATEELEENIASSLKEIKLKREEYIRLIENIKENIEEAEEMARKIIDEG